MANCLRNTYKTLANEIKVVTRDMILASEYKKKLIMLMCCYNQVWQNILLQSPQNEYTVTPLLKALGDEGFAVF